MTELPNKCAILGQLYADYQDDEDFKEFIEFNDLGLPLAYMISENLCGLTSDGEKYITETWKLFLDFLILKDRDFESLDEVFAASSKTFETNESSTETNFRAVVENLVLAGHFGVQSGQAMVGDPCYLDEWDTNKNEEWNLEGKVGQYSYQGASATTLELNYGEIGRFNAVVFSTGYGDGLYPVYVQMNEDGRVSKVVVDFEGEISED
jgi:hypothetical protein